MTSRHLFVLLLVSVGTCHAVRIGPVEGAEPVQLTWGSRAGGGGGTAWVGRVPTGVFLPVVLWHGMGDTCCSKGSMGAVKGLIETLLPGAFVHSIATGASTQRDFLSGYFGDSNDQVEQVCSELAALPELSAGFVAVGFSQGGQLLRAVVQRCQHLLPGKMHTLVTLGAQHQGIMEVPGCATPALNVTPSWACRAMQTMLGWGAYVPFVQRHSVQAQYWQDPYHLPAYLASSIFLAEINMEALGAPAGAAAAAAAANTLYRDNMASLQRLVLFQFEDDDMVVPKESSHFGVFSAAAGRVLRMDETPLYTEDRIGLRTLSEASRLVLARAPGLHMQISLAWLAEHVIKPYLAVRVDSGNTGSSSSSSGAGSSSSSGGVAGAGSS